MQCAEKRIQLRNGQHCVLRSLVEQDAKALLSLTRQAAAETGFLLQGPEEITVTEKQECAMIQCADKEPDSILLGAFVQGQLMASCGFTPAASYNRTKHRANLGISVLQEYWGLGVGSALLQELIHLAGQAGYEQLELSVLRGNKRGRSLYEKYGFVVCGTVIRACRYEDGSYEDELYAIRQIGN